MGFFANHSHREQGDKRNDESDAEETDEVRLEPVFFFALVQHDLQGGHRDHEQPDAHSIHLQQLLTVSLDPWRIVHQAVGEYQCEYPDGNIDVEDPVPAVIVGDPAAECGTDGGSENRNEAIEGEGEAALRGLE